MARSRREPESTSGTWKCLWEGCPDQGRRFRPPPGVTAMEDTQHHHRTVHGVQPDRPGIHFPARRGAA